MKNNKNIFVNFILDDKGYIKSIHAPGLPADYVKSLIKCAHSDIKNGYLLNEDKPAAETIPPDQKIISDVNYILSGGYLQNLPNED